MDKKRVSTKSKTKSTFGNLDMSKLQPQARDLEEAVLGALMLEKYAPEKVASYLKPAAFYVDAHQLIYEGIMQLFADGNPIDILTVTEQLRKNGTLESVGGAYKTNLLSFAIQPLRSMEVCQQAEVMKWLSKT